MTKKKIINTLLGLAIFGIICISFYIVGIIEHNYSLNGIIVEEEENNIFVVEDTTGNLWAFEGENFCINDNVKIWFNDNCTNSNRIDDIITKVEKV